MWLLVVFVKCGDLAYAAQWEGSLLVHAAIGSTENPVAEVLFTPTMIRLCPAFKIACSNLRRIEHSFDFY